MSKKKHPLDWYIDNTPSDDKEYNKGCLTAAIIVAFIFAVFTICILI